jgi:hypothetical protein
MEIDTNEYHYVKSDTEEYVRFSKDKWYMIYGGLFPSLEAVPNNQYLEEEFQKNLISK